MTFKEWFGTQEGIDEASAKAGWNAALEEARDNISRLSMEAIEDGMIDDEIEDLKAF